jgi:DNA-binding transcriptional MerR regulator
MIAIRYPLVTRHDPRERLTLEAAAERVGLHPVLVSRFVEFGLVEPAERTGAEVRFDSGCLRRFVTIARLRADLGVNLHGIAVILDLLDRLASQRCELKLLRQRYRKPAGGELDEHRALAP